MAKKTGVYLGDEASAYIDAHVCPGTTTSKTVNAGLARLEYILGTVRLDFTDAEWMAIYTARTGAVNEPINQAVSGLVGAIEDAIELDGVADQFEIDGPSLLGKLRKLDRLGRLAVIDRAERWWASQG